MEHLDIVQEGQMRKTVLAGAVWKGTQNVLTRYNVLLWTVFVTELLTVRMDLMSYVMKTATLM